eukprot:765983-Hanusia_phi.AAC.1
MARGEREVADVEEGLRQEKAAAAATCMSSSANALPAMLTSFLSPHTDFFNLKPLQRHCSTLLCENRYRSNRFNGSNITVTATWAFDNFLVMAEVVSEEATMYAFDACARRWAAEQVKLTILDEACSPATETADLTVLRGAIDGPRENGIAFRLIEKCEFNTNPSSLNTLFETRKSIEIHEKAMIFSRMSISPKFVRRHILVRNHTKPLKLYETEDSDGDSRTGVSLSICREALNSSNAVQVHKLAMCCRSLFKSSNETMAMVAITETNGYWSCPKIITAKPLIEKE